LPEFRNGQKFKLEKLKVLVPIITAIIGLFGTGLALWANNKTDDNKDDLKATVIKLQEVVTEFSTLAKQLNTIVIPRIQKNLEEMHYDNKQLVDDFAAIRERLAYVEGSLSRKLRREIAKKEKASVGMLNILDKAATNVKEKVEIQKKSYIPTLQTQQMKMGPSLDSIIQGK